MSATGAPARRGPSALRHRGFRQLSVAWVFTNVADSALYLMVAVWVKELTGSDGAAAAVFAALGLPAFVAPFIGQLVDRVSRKRLLAVANALMAPVVLSLVLVTGPGDLWLVYVVTFAYGAMGYVTAAAQSGLIRDLLDDDDLPGGNALLSTVDQAFRLLSPLLGTGLYVLAGPRAVVVLTTVCFAVTAVLLTRLTVTESPGEPASGAYRSQLAGGFRHLTRMAPLGVLTIALAIGVGATGLTNVAVFPVMEQGLGVDPAMLGVLVSLQGIGAVGGGLTSARLIRRWGEPRLITVGLLTMAMGMTPLAFAGTIGGGADLGVVMLGLVTVGAGAPWMIVAFVTLRQRLTPPRLQGRVAAASNVALNLPQTLLTMAGAAAIGVVDYRLFILTTIVLLLLATVVAGRVGRGDTVGPLTAARHDVGEEA
ncbi:MFS transporter [Georgenia sunbinii]|uniref:MFS transporter n=1 Tax=Georgenia sunbinii TaxID=3117728 RepID=UPI002F2643D0